MEVINLLVCFNIVFCWYIERKIFRNGSEFLRIDLYEIL